MLPNCHIVAFFLMLSLTRLPEGNSQCEQFPDDPLCQMQAFAGQRQVNGDIGQQQIPCNYQDLWLIPGKADASCTRTNPRKLVELDAKQVKIYPPIVKFPGCFQVEIKNVRILDAEGFSNSIFAKTEYQWLNVRGSENAKCQNASVNGCGGFGNNCYYCDICESLKMVGKQQQSDHEIPSGIAEHLQGMNCPSEPGYYTFRKQFCFNDWHWLDNNGDCRLDFLSEAEDQNGLRAAMAALQQVGYGTVVAKIRLAYNATPDIERKKAQKEAQIERVAMREIEQRKHGWDERRRGGSFDEFRRWYVEQKKGKWHKDEYLPWLLYENEVACIRLTFDVCERPPQQRWDSGGYTCI